MAWDRGHAPEAKGLFTDFDPVLTNWTHSSEYCECACLASESAFDLAHPSMLILRLAKLDRLQLIAQRGERFKI